MWKSPSKQLRDRKRLEMFIKTKSLCMALPFSELFDEEFIETMGVDMGEAVDILFSKLIRPEVMTKTLIEENASVRLSVQKKFKPTVLKFHIWIPRQKNNLPLFFLVRIISPCRVMSLLRCKSAIL